MEVAQRSEGKWLSLIRAVFVFTGICLGARYTFTARKEVILAGGAFGTPQLLLNSGIGNRQDLASVGVPVLYDLPDVGKNMHDHAAIVWEAQSTIPVPLWQPT